MTKPLIPRTRPPRIPVESEFSKQIHTPLERRQPSSGEREAARQILTPAELVEHLGIQAWDYLLVGDGSATQWDSPYGAGWAAALVTRQTGQVKWFYGSANAGTNATAEMMAYVNPLVWLAAHRTGNAVRHLHIVTDADYLVTASRYTVHNSHAELWQFFRSFERRGLKIQWHWIPRNCVSFNKMADYLSGKVRKATLEGVDEVMTEKARKRYFEPKPKKEPQDAPTA